MTIESVAEQFARNVGGYEYDTDGGRRTIRPHEMTALHDDGPYKHLRFASPDISFYRFDLLTAPQMLVFNLSGETYVFGGAQDMMELFRSGAREGVGPDYFAGKLASGGSGGRDGARRYSQERFEQIVKQRTVEAIRDGSAPRGIGRAVKRMLADGDTTWEGGARRELEEFEHGAGVRYTCSCGATATFGDDLDEKAFAWRAEHGRLRCHYRTEKVEGFRFTDFWEWSFKDFDHWFLWAFHAIVWAIGRYDEVVAGTGA